MDKRFEYLVRTLSRTKRKDYENYVVNAVWNRLNTREVKPVTQQYISHGEGHYLIDLYFPQLNIGIECDEEYHKKNVDQDKIREMTIFDVLKQVKKTSEYQALHVDVTKTYEEIEEEINNHVQTILSSIDQQKKNGSFKEWRETSPQEYFQDKSKILVEDDIGFGKIFEACNILFSTEYKGQMKSFFKPHTFKEAFDSEYMVWFPKLAIDNKAVAAGWNNSLSQDGKNIYEFNEKSKDLAYDIKEEHYIPRVTFTQVKDPVTRETLYRFVGVFKLSEIKGKKMKYTRIDDSFPLIND